MPNKRKVDPKDSRNVAEKHYELENKGETEFDQALKETHKLVTDHYFEGTIDQKYE